MADKQQENHNDSHSSSDNEEIDPSRIDKGLENFVTEHYQQQMEAGEMDNSEIDDERAANFFNRALRESQRMSAEVAKSHQKIEKLHGELGAETFASWRSEHAAEVLLPQQVAAVELASHSAPTTG